VTQNHLIELSNEQIIKTGKTIVGQGPKRNSILFAYTKWMIKTIEAKNPKTIWKFGTGMKNGVFYVCTIDLLVSNLPDHQHNLLHLRSFPDFRILANCLS
jgi:hypothetical protein